MNDALFDRFVNPDNLKLAFHYIKSEIRGSTLPLDPFWVPGVKAIEKLGDAFFNSVSKILQNSTYIPDSAYYFAQHKESFGLRKLAMLSMVDRVVYQALFNPNIMGNQICNLYQGTNSSQRIGDGVAGYLDDYQEFYETFWNMQENYYDKLSMTHRGECDIHCFYDSIDHTKLIDQLADYNIGSTKTRQLLLFLLSSWQKTGRGIPQGPQTSCILANFYLLPIDLFFQREGGSQIGYVRYMDDMVMHSCEEKPLFEILEKLTYELDALGLTLNNKSKIQLISEDFYNQRNWNDDYGDHPINASHYAKIEPCIPEIISKLMIDESVEHTDVSKLKYYLKASPDYRFAKHIISLYYKLPSLSETIARYFWLIAGEDWLQKEIVALFRDRHLFRWQKFWLVKLLLAGNIDINMTRIETCLDFRSSDVWELRSIAWLAYIKSGDHLVEPEEYFKLIENAENNFERVIYLGLAGYIENSQSREYLSKFLNSDVTELKLVVAGTLYSDTQIFELAKSGALFDKDQSAGSTNRNVVTNLLANDTLDTILGKKWQSDPKRRYIFEIKVEGNELLMMGSIMGGKSLSIFKSTRSSPYKSYLRSLIKLHSPFEKLAEHIYDSNLIDASDKVNAKSRSDRYLHPLCELFIDFMLVMNGPTVAFRPAIDRDCFDNLPENTKLEIAEFAKQIQNSVKYE